MGYDSGYRSKVLSRYEATLAAIEQGRREPTLWEAQCLMSALTSIATDSLVLAEYSINRSSRPNRDNRRPADVTVHGLREALAEVMLVSRS